MTSKIAVPAGDTAADIPSGYLHPVFDPPDDDSSEDDGEQ